MKNYISYFLVLGASLAATLAYADDEIKLKKSCIKDYPVVEGETSPEILTIYAQVCDKKNKDNKDRLLVSAAEKFQQLGKNGKALQIVSYLESQNIQSNELTDVKFLSGVGLAYDALNKMRNTEVRYLTEDKTYPVAKNFVDAVKNAAPATVLVEKQESHNTSTPTVKYSKPTKTKAVRPSRQVSPARSTPATTKPAPVVNKPKPASTPTTRPNFPM